jgi:hypothetical protein
MMMEAKTMKPTQPVGSGDLDRRSDRVGLGAVDVEVMSGPLELGPARLASASSVDARPSVGAPSRLRVVQNG